MQESSQAEGLLFLHGLESNPGHAPLGCSACCLLHQDSDHRPRARPKIPISQLANERSQHSCFPIIPTNPTAGPIKAVLRQPRSPKSRARMGGRGCGGTRAFGREGHYDGTHSGDRSQDGETGRAARAGGWAIETTPITAPSASCLVWKSSFLMPVRVCTCVCAGVHA